MINKENMSAETNIKECYILCQNYQFLVRTIEIFNLRVIKKDYISTKNKLYVNDAVTRFLPLVESITTLTKEIVDEYENVQCNKKTCGVLVNRVEAAEAAVKRLIRLKEGEYRQIS